MTAWVLEDSAGRFESVHHRHPDVHQHDVGQGLDDQVDGLCTVGRTPDDVQLGR